MDHWGWGSLRTQVKAPKRRIKGGYVRALGGTVLSLYNALRSQPDLWYPHVLTLAPCLNIPFPCPFSTVLPGGCPACDTHALKEALLCLEHHYAAFPLYGVTSFNSSHTVLENAADIGGLAIALQVTHIPKVRIFFH